MSTALVSRGHNPNCICVLCVETAVLTPIHPERTLFCGIDPGMSGGLAIIDPAGLIVDLTPMPETERDICDYFQEYSPRISWAVIEAVHSFPGQGIASAFKFGMGYGSLRMALHAFSIRFEGVSPMRWQKALAVPSGEKKDKKRITKARAQELFPSQKFTHKTADAALLAFYCREAHR